LHRRPDGLSDCPDPAIDPVRSPSAPWRGPDSCRTADLTRTDPLHRSLWGSVVRRRPGGAHRGNDRP